MTTVTAKQMHTQLWHVYNLVDQEGEVVIIKNSKPKYKIVRIQEQQAEERKKQTDTSTNKSNERVDTFLKEIEALPPTNAPSDLSTTYKDYIYTL